LQKVIEIWSSGIQKDDHDLRDPISTGSAYWIKVTAISEIQGKYREKWSSGIQKDDLPKLLEVVADGFRSTWSQFLSCSISF
jgi:hypothetical protein